MSTCLFQVTEHVIACQHIREYPYAVKCERQLLKLAIKEYQPLDNLDASPGSITLIATHANGMAKEVYEPLWDELYGAINCKIGAIWIADSAHQGASGVLNEDLLGDDPSCLDHSRDLLAMINHFRERMPRPIMGIGHSLGTVQLVQLSLMHPRLFHSLTLIEPVIARSAPPGRNPAFPTSHRRDWWRSRSAAEAHFLKIPLFKAWEPRVLKKYVLHGLRETPTAIYPELSAGDATKSSEATFGGVTLTTTKHQESWGFARSYFAPQATDPNDRAERLISPDVDPNHEPTYAFHRAEIVSALRGLPQLRPCIMWMFGAQSAVNPIPLQDEKMELSGTGVGGSGGVRAGRVKKFVIEESGHLAPFEKVQECANKIARWLEDQVDDFNAEQRFYSDFHSGKSERGMSVMSEDWLKSVRQNSDITRPVKGKL